MKSDLSDCSVRYTLYQTVQFHKLQIKKSFILSNDEFQIYDLTIYESDIIIINLYVVVNVVVDDDQRTACNQLLMASFQRPRSAATCYFIKLKPHPDHENPSIQLKFPRICNLVHGLPVCKYFERQTADQGSTHRPNERSLIFLSKDGLNVPWSPVSQQKHKRHCAHHLTTFSLCKYNFFSFQYQIDSFGSNHLLILREFHWT